MRLIINIDVPKLAPAIDFYSNALNLKLNRTIDSDVAELTGASTTIYLLEKDSATDVSSSIEETRRYSRHWTPVHLDFVVDDINQAAERARRAGARQESACVDWRGSKCITFSDPFGHGFCLIEFEGNTYR